MSRTSQVIKNKSRAARNRRKENLDEMNELKERTSYRARLLDEFKYIDVLLDEEGVDAVVIKVPPESKDMFSYSRYTDDLSNYDIRQSGDEFNRFEIRKRYIDL